MTMGAIKEAIEHLPDQDRRKLADWLEEMEERVWDSEMERDFASGGRGRWLVEEVEADVREGRTITLEQVLDEARAKQLKGSETQV